jgi:hypothetical protein
MCAAGRGRGGRGRGRGRGPSGGWRSAWACTPRGAALFCTHSACTYHIPQARSTAPLGALQEGTNATRTICVSCTPATAVHCSSMVPGHAVCSRLGHLCMICSRCTSAAIRTAGVSNWFMQSSTNSSSTVQPPCIMILCILPSTPALPTRIVYTTAITPITAITFIS